LSERDPDTRKRSLDAMRRTANDPKLARDYMLKSSMIGGLRRAAEIQ
jgi:3-(3-hydroxy-phenyl)propionate hydroxylase